MGRALSPCVCGGSAGWCWVSLSGYVWVQRDRRKEGGDACKDHLAGHRPSPATRALFCLSLQKIPSVCPGKEQ